MSTHADKSWGLVTGAAGAIGAEVCRQLTCAGGVEVIGVDTRPADPDATWQTMQCDLADAAAREALLAELQDRHGPPQVWASCAGRYERIGIEDYDSESFEQVMEDNFNHAFWLAQRLVPAMASAGGGRIVLVSSQAGAAGGADAAYAAAKAAVTALGKSISREYGPAGVVCNVVSPGPTDTPMATAMGPRRRHYEEAMPIRRLVRADEVAEVIHLLLSSRQEAMTGATVDVDGGLLRR